MKEKVHLPNQANLLAIISSDTKLKNAILSIQGSDSTLSFAEFEKVRLRLFEEIGGITSPVACELTQYLENITALQDELFENKGAAPKAFPAKSSSPGFFGKKSHSDRSMPPPISASIKKKDHYGLKRLTSRQKTPAEVEPPQDDLAKLFRIIREKLLPLLISPCHLALIQEEGIKAQMKTSEAKVRTPLYPLIMMSNILQHLVSSLNNHCSNLPAVSPRSNPNARKSKEELLVLLIALLKRLSSFYNEAHPLDFPATLTGIDISARSIPQDTAYQLLGVEADGNGRPWIFKTATHWVIQIGSNYYKTDRYLPPLQFGKECFIQRIFHCIFPNEAPSFLTPSTLLRLENVFIKKNPKGASEMLSPRFIQASTAVEGISLTNWLIIKEITDSIRARQGVDILKEAIYDWITLSYVKEVNLSKLFERLIDNQRNMLPRERISQFEILAGRDKIELLSDYLQSNEFPDAVKNLPERLKKEENEETIIQAFSFILRWPILAAGRNINDIIKWVALLSRLPELFLNLSEQRLRQLKNNPLGLKNKITVIETQLFNLWKLLDLPNALALAAGSLILGTEDGKPDNYQVSLKKDEQGKLIGWSIVFIDIGGQMLERGVVTEIANASGNLKNAIKHRAGIKSILFMLPPIRSALCGQMKFTATAECLFLNAMLAAKTANEAYTRFFNSQLYTEGKAFISDQEIPFRFTADDLPCIYEGLKTLINFARHCPNDSFEKLFYAHNPLLARYYSLNYNSLAPLQSYRQMYSMTLEDIIPMEETVTESGFDFSNGYEADGGSSGLVRKRKNSTSAPRGPIKQSSGSKLENINSSHSSPNLLQQVSGNGSPRTLGQLMALSQGSRLDEPQVQMFCFEQAFKALLKLFPWREAIQDKEILTQWTGLITKIIPGPFNWDALTGDPAIAKMVKDLLPDQEVSTSSTLSI
ncbi:hypothetical protein Lbir_2879 [Legionella birminghamensis]|uniref:Uncharacterized protein n=1 Tax=Legionella birminghamensis TaxID=28083 RepID=A0A378I8G0_9GAMM|nr:hypothetical protein [Legionella birminghamensis]KTC68277.1 hypothetical protein Lbir_2879 [Legionella birminghamensis]STX31010.1 Uncharacterised protein [Legionella birminghamensis]